jgi:hypothetical protein
MKALKHRGAKDKRLANGEGQRMGQSIALRIMLDLQSDICRLLGGDFGGLISPFQQKQASSRCG